MLLMSIPVWNTILCVLKWTVCVIYDDRFSYPNYYTAHFSLLPVNYSLPFASRFVPRNAADADGHPQHLPADVPLIHIAPNTPRPADIVGAVPPRSPRAAAADGDDDAGGVDGHDADA